MGIDGWQGAGSAQQRSDFILDDDWDSRVAREVAEKVAHEMDLSLRQWLSEVKAIIGQVINGIECSPDADWSEAGCPAQHNLHQQSQQQPKQQIEPLVAQQLAAPRLARSVAPHQVAGGDLALEFCYPELALPLAFDTAGSLLDQSSTGITRSYSLQAVMRQQQQCTLVRCMEEQCWQQRWCRSSMQQPHRHLCGHVT